MSRVHDTEDLGGKWVGFIVRTRRERFKPLIGQVIGSGDSDTFVWVGYTESDYPTSEEALTALRDSGTVLARIFTAPIPSGQPHWLEMLIEAEREART